MKNKQKALFKGFKSMKKSFLLLVLMSTFLILELGAKTFLQQFDEIFTFRTYGQTSETRIFMREIKDRINFYKLHDDIRQRLSERDKAGSFIDCELDCYIVIKDGFNELLNCLDELSRYDMPLGAGFLQDWCDHGIDPRTYDYEFGQIAGQMYWSLEFLKDDLFGQDSDETGYQTDIESGTESECRK
jgi:hypothetical protein